MDMTQVSPNVLACGPYLSEQAALGSLALLLVVKPLAYFAFVLAFRYRVSRGKPLSVAYAAKLAGIRSLIGILIIGGATAALLPWARESLLVIVVGWVILCLERIGAWWYVGASKARLRGRRLLGWIISGTLINAAFDVGVFYGLLTGPTIQIIVALAIGAFIAGLYGVGMRRSLRARFDPSLCRTCFYDLTGNQSARCPECGSPFDIRRVPVRVTTAAP
jgi:hypothetical protein